MRVVTRALVRVRHSFEGVMADERDQPYLEAHYGVRHRIVAAISRLVDDHVYTVRHGLLRGLKRRGGLSFLPQWVFRGTDDTPESRFFASLDVDGKVVYDVGGFQGLLTMFFATRAKTVVVYEPNPSSRTRLEDNLRLNGIFNVVVRPVGAAAEAGAMQLVYDPRMPGGATANKDVVRQIAGSTPGMHQERIDVVTIDDDVVAHRLPLPDVVKIDVEGMELDVLRGMRHVLRTSRPGLYIEMHGATRENKRDNARAVLEELIANGYQKIVHVESGLPVTIADSERAAEGHLWCTGDGRRG